jgi:hypothetical protein
MIAAFVDSINVHLSELFSRWPDTKLYGLAELVVRRRGTEAELWPCVLNNDGEGQYVGIDDIFSVSLYHKLNGVTSQVRSVSAYGDSTGNIVNTYQMSLVVFLDRKRTDLTAGDVLIYIQANYPNRIVSESFKNNIIRFTGAVLNSRAVFEREYQGANFLLPPEKSVFEITYSIESIFSKDCFNNCPC